MQVIRRDSLWWIEANGKIVAGPFETLREAEDFLDHAGNQRS